MESMILPSHAQIAQIDDVSRFMGPWALGPLVLGTGIPVSLAFVSTEIRDAATRWSDVIIS